MRRLSPHDAICSGWCGEAEQRICVCCWSSGYFGCPLFSLHDPNKRMGVVFRFSLLDTTLPAITSQTGRCCTNTIILIQKQNSPAELPPRCECKGQWSKSSVRGRRTSMSAQIVSPSHQLLILTSGLGSDSGRTRGDPSIATRPWLDPLPWWRVS